MVHESHSQDVTVVVGIPAYNEAETVGEIVAAARPYADEVIVVDDGSDDDTSSEARSAGATVIPHRGNRGYGAALGTIFRVAEDRGAEHLVIVDADGQHDVEDVPTLVDTQRERDAEIVTGSRFSGTEATDIPLYRRFGLGVVNLLTNLGLQVGYSYESVSDSQCGFRAYDSRAIETMANATEIDAGMGASLDILFRAAGEGYDIAEVPTEIDYDVADANTEHPIRHGLGLMLSLVRCVTRDRPRRVAAVGTVAALSVGGVLAAVVAFGPTVFYVLVPMLFTLAVAISSSLAGRYPSRSDRTDR